MIQYTTEQIKRSPYLLCRHAAQTSKGKLPDDLHHAMTLHSFIDSDNFFVKLYFQQIMTGNLGAGTILLDSYVSHLSGSRLYADKRIYGELDASWRS